jgi:hypothetical protein
MDIRVLNVLWMLDLLEIQLESMKVNNKNIVRRLVLTVAELLTRDNRTQIIHGD